MSDELELLETDAETIAAANLASLETATGRTLYPGDPVRLITLALSYVQAVFAQAANHAANQSFLDYATDTALEALGARDGVTRRDQEAARTTLRFYCNSRALPTVVPAGTRVTCPGSGVYFATIETVEIPAGQISVDVIGEATVVGPSANGYLANELTELVDIVPFIATVTNTTATSDGSEAEDDASLRERIREAPAGFSVAGPKDAYIYQTKAARADVDSVTVHSPTPCVIDVYFTLTAGAIPAAETIAEVQAYLSDEYRRPLGDQVTVHAPTPVNYTIELTYYIASRDSARVAAIEAAVILAVADYVAWQRAQIGRDVNPSELIKRVMDAGALRVTVTSPAYAAADYSELAVLSGEAVVTNGGVVDE